MTGILEGRVAIVTGSGRGIGRGIAVELAREGAKVVVASRSQGSIDDTLSIVAQAGGTAVGQICDVGEHADIVATVERAVSAFGGLDILVNNAQAFGTKDAPDSSPVLTGIEKFRDAEWDLTFQTGPTASYLFMKAAFPHLVASGRGRIINFGSYWGQAGNEGSVAYNAAKEAIRGLSRTAAREWGKHAITCNVINPAIETDALRNHTGGDPAATAAAAAGIPLRRFGDIFADGGRIAVFLASDDAAFLTGMTFQVDGGLFMYP
ncbi:SDR family oxidoreductase [Novosphingobium sp. ERN07]|uniref:SDR family NAD(P)-dependent oxidoreductase n=1 Tax=Novosphingobium sp. ERN07 TaxID=2726187 RepID=UPI001456674F|nr:SDR family oxidoreductase [Novosphingobium sp. ERN07]NLR72774.1 SDR family oxidoreductase [Novosphingobium sp. ERN07]